MNTFTRVQDVLDNAVKLHERLYQHFDTLSDLSTNERSKLMFKYLGDHEHRLADQTKLITKGVTANVRDTWLQFTMEIPPATFINNLGLEADSGFEVIAEKGHVIDDYFAGIFGALKDVSHSSEVRTIFEELESIETLEHKSLARAADAMLDM